MAVRQTQRSGRSNKPPRVTSFFAVPTCISSVAAATLSFVVPAFRTCCSHAASAGLRRTSCFSNAAASASISRSAFWCICSTSSGGGGLPAVPGGSASGGSAAAASNQTAGSSLPRSALWPDVTPVHSKEAAGREI